MNQIPSNLGFRMPAEWESHSAVWLAWPYDKITFGSLNQRDSKLNLGRLVKVEKEFIKIITALETSEKIQLLIREKEQYIDILKKASVFEADYADVWTRDYMPIFVKNQDGQLTAVKWIYNAYGEKFTALVKDNNVWAEVNKKLKINTVQPKIILEGGAIEVNGVGTLLTTEQCILTRNPNLSKGDAEKIFAKHLGISKVIWLKKGLANDHTDGHIDELARFVAPNKIVCAYEDDGNDENFKILEANCQVLKNSTGAQGKPFEVIKLPMPHMVYDDGNKAPVSYCNFYIGNKVVLASTFNDPNDAAALQIIQDCFPDRKIVGIDCTDIIYGGGAIHCMTQQVPDLP